MTVTNPTVVYRYPGNSVTVTFAYPQAFIAQTDLRVLLLDANGIPQIEPPPALNGGGPYDYHITGASDPDTGAYPAGGAVVLNNPPGPATTIEIARILPITQPVAFIDDAAIPASTLNLEFDRLTMIAQQLDAGLFTQSGDLPPQASPDYAGMVPVVLPDGSGYEMRTALLLSQSDASAFDATNHRIEDLAAPAASSDAATKGYVDGGEAAAKAYIDAGDAATLTAAENYANTKDATTLASAKSYADAGDTATLTAAENYANTHDATTLASAKSYADAGDTATLTAAKGYTDTAIAGTGQVSPPAAGDTDSVLTALGVDNYAWEPINATKIVNGTLSAQRLNLGTRLSANGTKLNGLGPTTVYNGPTAASNNAVDGAINQNNGGVNHAWGLQAATPGACLSIQLADSTHTCTIVPAPGDVIVSPSGAFTNASPMVIPAMPRGANAHLFLIGRAGGWDLLSINPEIAEAMGWVSHPYFKGSFGGGVSGFSPSIWTKNAMTMEVDSHGWWDAGNFRYVPKRPGRYLATYQAQLGDTTSVSCTAVYAAIYINGSTLDSKTIQGNGASFLPLENFIACTTIAHVNGVTDYLEPYMFVAAAAPVVWGPGVSSFIVTYLGP